METEKMFGLHYKKRWWAERKEGQARLEDKATPFL